MPARGIERQVASSNRSFKEMRFGPAWKHGIFQKADRETKLNEPLLNPAAKTPGNSLPAIRGKAEMMTSRMWEAMFFVV
jgi:hypothetical protein